MKNTIFEKLRAILKQAEEAHTEGEATVFMAMFEKLSKQHGININDLDADANPMGEDNIDVADMWQRKVASSLADYLGCTVVFWNRRSGYRIAYQGRYAARETFKYMFPYLKKAVGRQASEIIKREWPDETDYIKSRQRYYLKKDIGIALAHRIALLADAKQRTERREGVGDIIPIDEVEAFRDELYPELGTARETEIKLYAYALDAANNIGLDPHVNREAGDTLQLT